MGIALHPVQVSDALKEGNGSLLRLLLYKHVLVDEFQDANDQQLELLQLLGRGGDGNVGVTVIGDDDQSIYGFRWAVTCTNDDHCTLVHT